MNDRKSAKNKKNRRKPVTFWIGVSILIFFSFIAIFAPAISPYPPNQLGIAFLKPSPEHWLGTNDIGQDILSELIYGTRISLSVGIVAALVITCFGTLLGLMGGYYGGLCDRLVCMLIDGIMTLPSLPLSFVLAALLPSGFGSLLITICITSWASTARIIRSRTMQLREFPFVQASRAMGTSSAYILAVQIFPNLKDLVFTKGTLAVSNAMMMEASLSFLGLGMISEKSWGKILQYALNRKGVLNGYWWWYIPPILCISLCVMGFMLICYREE